MSSIYTPLERTPVQRKENYLINISTLEPEILTRGQAFFYLQCILTDRLSVQGIYDKVDLNKIIYIEEAFKDDEEIQTMVSAVKDQVYRTYRSFRQRLKKLVP